MLFQGPPLCTGIVAEKTLERLLADQRCLPLPWPRPAAPENPWHHRTHLLAVGPVYDSAEASAPLLESAYRSSLRLANERGLRRIAFPAISCGIFGYPLDEAAEVGPVCPRFCQYGGMPGCVVGLQVPAGAPCSRVCSIHACRQELSRRPHRQRQPSHLLAGTLPAWQR